MRAKLVYCPAMAHLSESIEVDAAPEAVYALVSDLPRMGAWSPECTGVTWRGDVRRPVEGARFVGHNRSGRLRWSTFGSIVVAEAGRRFAFEVTFGPVKVARWEYLFERAPSGCTVTEEWTDRRPVPMRRLMDAAVGSRERANRRGMQATLAALKAEAEHQAQAVSA
jgi:Polyketide cyclase / dehydrase and lipid transport